MQSSLSASVIGVAVLIGSTLALLPPMDEEHRGAGLTWGQFYELAKVHMKPLADAQYSNDMDATKASLMKSYKEFLDAVLFYGLGPTLARLKTKEQIDYFRFNTADRAIGMYTMHDKDADKYFRLVFDQLEGHPRMQKAMLKHRKIMRAYFP